MSEQTNIALIQNIYAAFGRGDIQAILDQLTPDVDWTLEGPHIIPYAGHFQRLDGVKRFFDALGSTQKDQRLSIEEYIAQGDKVATFGRYSAAVKATGKTMDAPLAHLFTVRDGKVSKWICVAETASTADAYRGAAAAA